MRSTLATIVAGIAVLAMASGSPARSAPAAPDTAATPRAVAAASPTGPAPAEVAVPQGPVGQGALAQNARQNSGQTPSGKSPSGQTDPARGPDIWHAARALLPGDIIRKDDIIAHPTPRPLPEAVVADQDIVGQQIKRRVYPDRPLTARDIGPRTAVQASTPVNVLWSSGPLKMEMEGRAMESGALGDEVRILNTSSGRTIRGIVVGDGMVEARSVQ
jgi:flagella basal body P-ring formation protein FlgA